MKKILFTFCALFMVMFLSAQELTEIKASQLPKKINDYFKKTLVSYSVERAGKSVEKGVTVKYAVLAESHGRKSVYVFDGNANFVGRARNYKEAEAIKVPAPVPAKTGSTGTKKPEAAPAQPVKK